jgi:hypothetical protein
VAFGFSIMAKVAPEAADPSALQVSSQPHAMDMTSFVSEADIATLFLPPEAAILTIDSGGEDGGNQNGKGVVGECGGGISPNTTTTSPATLDKVVTINKTQAPNNGRRTDTFMQNVSESFSESEESSAGISICSNAGSADECTRERIDCADLAPAAGKMDEIKKKNFYGNTTRKKRSSTTLAKSTITSIGKLVGGGRRRSRRRQRSDVEAESMLGMIRKLETLRVAGENFRVDRSMENYMEALTMRSTLAAIGTYMLAHLLRIVL